MTRGWDGWMASPTRWTWVWASSWIDGQGALACCSPLGHKELDRTEWLNWTELNILYIIRSIWYLKHILHFIYMLIYVYESTLLPWQINLIGFPVFLPIEVGFYFSKCIIFSKVNLGIVWIENSWSVCTNSVCSGELLDNLFLIGLFDS